MYGDFDFDIMAVRKERKHASQDMWQSLIRRGKEKAVSKWQEVRYSE